MVLYSFSSSSPFSSPSSSSRCSSRTTTENGGASASSAVISGDGIRNSTIHGTKTKLVNDNGNVQQKPSRLLVATTVISMVAVALTTGSFGSGSGLFVFVDAPIREGRNNDATNPSMLRRGNLEDIVSSPFRSPTAARRSLQENVVDNSSNITENDTILCDLDSCQAAFEGTLCSMAESEEESSSSLASIPIYLQVLILVVLLSFSALFSGLTLGLMSLDITGLEIVMAGDDPVAAKNAETIYPLRKQGNLLLCTLLLGNVAVNSLMSIFSAAIFDGTIGFLSSTFLIVIFGEIIPQALCSRYALRIGSAAVPTVKVIRCLLYILSYPLAKGLDCMLGRELATTYSNAEMIELLKVHVKENRIDQEEANAMTGALTYKNVQVKDAMTAMEQTFMLGVDEKLSFDTIGKIFKTGYSRIPIFEISRNNIVGLLFVKDLIFLDPEDCVPIRSFIQIFGRNVHQVWPDDILGDVLAVLKKGKSHLAVVRDVNNEDETQDPVYEVKGIITLEDIVERIIGDSIVDETDAFVDSNQSIKVERGKTFEWARLRLLDTKIVDEMLTTSEIGAITAHLKTNHSKSFHVLTDSQLTRLVSTTPVTTFPTATQDLHQELPNDLLYEKNLQSDSFTLVLSGKITLFVGSENFRSDISSWSVLGANALQHTDWTPDYSAFVSDGPCRCIQISRSAFVDASDASVVERRIAESNAAAAAIALANSNRNHPRSSTAYWPAETLSVASSMEYEDDGSTISSIDGKKVSDRRKDVLAKLFNNCSTHSRSVNNCSTHSRSIFNGSGDNEEYSTSIHSLPEGRSNDATN